MKESIRSLNDCSGTSTTDKSEMAEILCCQFESVFSLDDGNEPIFENRTEHLTKIFFYQKFFFYQKILFLTKNFFLTKIF